MRKTYLTHTRMRIAYQAYLDSTDVCEFSTWLKRHFNYSDYQIKRLVEFSKTEEAGNIVTSLAWD